MKLDGMFSRLQMIIEEHRVKCNGLQFAFPKHLTLCKDLDNRKPERRRNA